MIRAVIFDMDGVISDTLPLHGESQEQLYAQYGITITPQELTKQFNGLPDTVISEKLFSRINQKPNHEKLAKENLVFFKKIAKDRIKQIPGSLEFIHKLVDENIILGLASSSPTEIIELVLTTLGIKDKFRATTSTVEMKRGKPFPDIFLRTAEKLGIDPKDCVVIEDAPRGIEAAKSAGMKCIAITTTHPKEELTKADKIIGSFDQLTVQYIKNL